MTVTTNLNNAEKQLITTLSWFRSRYALYLGLSPERKADKENIEQFGKIWIGNFKENWDEAFDSLVKKNIITYTNKEYDFTEKGQIIKNKIESEIPFYKYEYDHFFESEKKSEAHAKFCEEVYGLNLSQHGLIDQYELSILIVRIKKTQPQKILDIGCGNGKITEWIAKITNTHCIGIDISDEAISLAKERTIESSLLHFEKGNLNNLNIREKFDGVLFLDTLYYSNNLIHTLEQAIRLLNKNGRIYAYFSQWIMDTSFQDLLLPENTHLGKALNALQLKYTITDLTESGNNHWKKKLKILDIMKDEFLEEGSIELWEYRYREANRYANWGEDKYARYLFEISI